MKSASDIVVERLTEAIIDGQINPGDKIPTEPELASSFCVGRNTVREAVRTLVAYGILEIRRPEGTFVCRTFKPQTINPLIYSMILQKKESYQDLIGLRQCIEFGTLQVIMDQGLNPEDAENLRQIDLIVTVNEMLSKLTYGSRIRTIEQCIREHDRKYLVDIHFEILKILEERDTDAIAHTLKRSYSYWANLQMEEE